MNANTTYTNATKGTSNIMTSIILLAAIGFITVAFYFASKTDNSIKDLFGYSTFMIVPFLVIMLFILSRIPDTNSFIYTVMSGLLAATSIIIVIYFFATLSTITVLSIANILNIIATLMILIGMAIAFYYLSTFLKTSSGTSRSTRFYVYLITYIPCLFIDLANYVVKEYNITTRPIVLLFLAELVLLILYFYLPTIVNGVMNLKPHVLLADISYLDKKKEIANSDMLLAKDPNDSTKTSFRKNYAISMWLYLNVQPPNYSAYNAETNIFNYGGGMPRITYFNGGTGEENDKIIVYFTNQPEHNGVPVNMKKQKWNNLVFNYNSDSVDLFINGNLEKTVDITKFMPFYSPIDTVIVGDDNGLYGAICNVVYYGEPLSEIAVVNSYNLQMNNNPPTNNL